MPLPICVSICATIGLPPVAISRLTRYLTAPAEELHMPKL
jgi:hypothetical protein